MKTLLALVSAAVLVASCGDDGTGPGGISSVDVSAPLTTVRVGESLQLTATARKANGDVVIGEAVTWRSSADNVATVSTTGLVSGMTVGPVTVTATVSGVSGSVALTVTAAAAAIVSMPGFSFVPFTTSISIGGSVRYDFPAEPHNVIFAAVTGAPADIQATTNRSVTRTFTVAGTFPYDCTLHPGMSGVVVVR